MNKDIGHKKNILSPKNVQDFFEQQQLSTPNSIAISFGYQQISFTELNIKADLLSGVILAEATNQDIVAVSATKNIEMVIGLLAILKAGKAYLPLDLKYPKERLKKIVEDSGIKTCLAMRTEKTDFLELGLNVINTDGNHPQLNLRPAKKSSIACVLYTSGSTGVPKGVCLKHEGLVNLLQSQIKNSVLKAGDRTLQFCHLSFDAAFQEIFVPLSSGGHLILIDDDTRLNAHKLLETIGVENINRIFLPYVSLQYLAEAAEAINVFPKCLKEVITGGEVLKITSQIRRFFSVLSEATLVNVYGPTETSVWVTENKLKGNAEHWPALPSLGQAIENVEIFILNETLEIVTESVPGEICISGVCLADGYLNQSELTKDKFLEWKHPEQGPTLIYRTGDLGCFHPDKSIGFLGRKDNQVKIRGNRIELAEIEVAISQANNIQQVAVIAREDVPGNKYLAAYLISSSGENNTIALREMLAKKLPDYMLPSVFVWLKEFPKTTSGKVDRKALPKPDFKRPKLSSLYKPPYTATEKTIANVWSELLQLDKVGVNDNFFELGGNSLLAVKTIAALRQKHGFQLGIAKLYQYPTIKQIALFVEGKNEQPTTLKIDNKKATECNDIAIIGMAGRFPGANTIEELWEILKSGKETTKFFSEEELDPSISKSLKQDERYIKARGIIDKAQYFDASFFGINPKLAELMDPQQRIFLEIAWEVLETANHLPEHFPGTIGVYAGCGNNTYFINNVLSQKDLIEKTGSLQVTTVNDKDYISSRTAYCLNLKGPAVTVQSACSTSLLAIVQAVEAIRKSQCDVAIAGGAAISVPINNGHIYQEGAMLSSDGHCRPFDASASGTVFSDGAGVILLKRKDRAEADGNTIYAIIKGIGISNDGGDKGSFTAPSTEGQAAAISMAIQDAGIDPSFISYVETHGTATPLGDPIEIEGLKLAFGHQQKNQYCAIGSIKSNMGHLTIAAGVAGVIKTALALHHKQLPASIHFKKPNPEIDFTNSPFFVNNEFKEWKSENKKIAGVSSFGVGGTNVHIILEEAEALNKESSVNRPTHLISWSAKTEWSLREYPKKLLNYLLQHEEVNLADISYTLQTCKQQFNHRDYIVASSNKDLIEKLSLKLESSGKKIDKDITDIIFMFPGQGSQHINMAKDFYHNEPVFKGAVEECVALFEKELKGDIRLFIYPENANTEAEENLKNTRYAQPSLFVIEYAFAKLWISWGLQPSCFIGHSIGEFVAAHLAGVFSLGDAIKLIAARGSLMSELPKGSMLSIRIEPDKLKLLLPDTLSIAAINSPGLCVVAGPYNLVHTFSEELEKRGIVNRLLNTSHAFHSAMMDPVVEPFEKIVQTIALHPPRIPIISTVTGEFLTNEEALDAHYWANHLRAPVLFATAIKTSLDRGFKMFLEAGPRNILATLTKQQSSGSNSVILESADLTRNVSNYECILNTIGTLWINGVQPEWKAFYAGQKRLKIQLPTYAFERKLFWVDPLPAQLNIANPKLEIANEIIQTKIALAENKIMRKTLLVEKLKKIIEDTSGVDIQSIDAGATFIEIGLDSLLLTQIALVLKKEFSLPISFRQLNEEYNCLNALSNYLDQNLPAHKYQPKEEPTTYTHFNSQTPASPNLSLLPGLPTSETALGLISQQLQLLAKQVALLQNANPGSALVPEAISSNMPPISVELKAEEESEIKKPFGAIARIEKHSTALSSKQQEFLDRFIKNYTEKTEKSKRYTQKYRACMADPRVVSGFKPALKEMVYSLVVNKSKGCRLWDIDGNEYIDVLNGFGSNFLGYQNEHIKNALHEQIDSGFEIGPQHELAGEVSNLICEFTGFDRAALCNTGSEAVLGAMRIARTVTGRSTIVAFTGSYHGIIDEALVRGTKKLKTFPAAPGIMPEAVQNMLILEYGTEESLQIIKDKAHELAAVLVEPVQSRRPEFQPIAFLKELRKITQASGTTLIFDEIITGFRMHTGGVQAMFGIQADLATYGKVVGGGMSVGVIAGKKDFMDALDGGYWQYGDASIPEAGVTYFAGTFVRHPLALASTKASLEYMKAKGPALQEGVSAKTTHLVESLNMVCESYGLPLVIVQFGSLWRLKFTQELPYSELLASLMRLKGIYIADPFPCFITEAHTEEDISTIIKVFKSSVDELIEADFLPSTLNRVAKQQVEENEPPVPGAKLGRDPNGKSAWFISDPNRPGKYLQLNFKN